MSQEEKYAVAQLLRYASEWLHSATFAMESVKEPVARPVIEAIARQTDAMILFLEDNYMK